MARGRGGSYDQGVVTITRRRQLSLEPEIEIGMPHSRTAQRITNFAAEDADTLSHKSRNKDRQLLNDITTRLHRVDFDRVKPDFDVAMKTGFRRKMYHKKLPPLEKETREAMRKDILRYPWDHTQDNLYRPIKHKKDGVKRNEEKVKKETLKSYEDIIKEPSLNSPYPVYDPMGVYTKRPKQVHKELPELKNKYDTMNIREKLATVRAKVQSMPRARDASRDVDTVLEDLCRPIPKSLVAGTEMYTIDDYYAIDENMKFDGLDSNISSKIKASRGDIDEFDRMLTERFGTKKKLEFSDILGRKRGVPPPPPPQIYDYDEEQRELGLHQNGPTIAEPVIIHHVQQSPPRVVPRTATRVTAASSAAPRYRSSSLPPSPRGVPRSSRIAQIEARLERETEDYSVSPKPETLSSLRSRAVNIKNKMDAHKSMMDRYLPIYLGPENEVGYEVDYKFGELVNRMPVLDRHRPFQGSSTVAPITPYKPASKSSKPPLGNSYGPAARTSFRPKVSDTRKRIREVMCATKKDPHYYD